MLKQVTKLLCEGGEVAILTIENVSCIKGMCKNFHSRPWWAKWYQIWYSSCRKQLGN